MRRIRRASVLVAMTAAAALPVVAIGPAGAQDAGDCGNGGVAASASQENLGGLAGALFPVVIQAVTPVNAPVLSPSLGSCNRSSSRPEIPGFIPPGSGRLCASSSRLRLALSACRRAISPSSAERSSGTAWHSQPADLFRHIDTCPERPSSRS